MVWYLIFIGYALGIEAGLFFDTPFFVGGSFVWGVSAIVVWQRSKLAWGMAVAFVLMGAGYVQAHATLRLWQAAQREYTVFGRAIIVRSPEIKERSQEVVLRFTQCSNGACPEHLVLAYFPIYDELRYGDIVTTECPLKIPKNIGIDFDYRMYLAMKGIGYTCYPKEWHVENDEGGNALVRWVLGLRSLMEEKLDAYVAYPESGLGKGLLFGGNGYLTKETQTAFSRTGMSHIVAVSGANVVIVSQSLFLLAILCGLWRRQALWAAGLGVVFFVVMVGASASALRAGLMGGLVLLSGYSGRVSDGLRLWSLALALMLCFNPLLLRYDLGFQLSFMATLGILLCMPLFEKIAARKNVPALAMLQEIFWMTMSAEMFVLPIILYNFHALPSLSLLANLLVLPAIPVAMLFGFLASVFGFFLAPLAKLFGLLDYLVLHYMMSVIGVLSGQSFASVEVKSFGVMFLLGWYGVLFMVVFFLRRRCLSDMETSVTDS
ncbi:MAG: ComEC/Rec2 family competence protein [Candidatus Moranbacteria bacterium]|nr:ComEC/Rec2 family competence protein [Candidatus Moranbacteria bacterium]